MKNPSERIPRHLIQTAKTRELPPLEKAAQKSLRLLHPDWKLLFFDDNDVRDFIIHEFPNYLEIFDSFPRAIQRFDFFRYLAVYRLGGFYLDTDVFLSEALDPLLSNDAVFAFEELSLSKFLREEFGVDWEIANYAFGAIPGCPFLAAVIENCVRTVREPSWINPMMDPIPAAFRQDYYVLNSTGPGMLTRTLVENPAFAPSVHVLFPADVCNQTTWHKFGDFGLHLMAATWRTQKNVFHRRALRWWENRTRARQLIESRKLGPNRALLTSSLLR